jgi:cysteine desulfurase
MKVYLDNAATTKVADEVVEEMKKFSIERFGNASSLHGLGREAREAIEKTREKIAKFLGVEAKEIIFTSGGTEADNLAIKGLALANPEKRHIITSKIEHAAVLETCKELEERGYNIDYISIDKEGIVNLGEIENKICKDTLVVSVMHINNEIGTIQPIEEIAELCKRKGVYFHTDAVQGFGKLKINMKNIDLLSASAHKINGPKGVGFLYIKNETKIKPIISGGGQEFGIRSGTENVAGIIGLGKAVELANKNMRKQEKIKKLRDKLLGEILKIDAVRLNGSKEKRIFNNINVSFKNIEGESLVMMLDKEEIAASTGSACSSHSLEPSHVLKALGLSDVEAHGSLRLTLGYDTTEEEIDYAAEKIRKAVENLRKFYSK